MALERMSKPIRVVEKKIQRCQPKVREGGKFLFGQLHPDDGLIEVDPRQCEKEGLDTRIHEAIHAAMPKWDKEEEATISKIAFIVTNVLWAEGYRRVRLK